MLTLNSSVTQSCPTACDPMDCSTPGIPVLSPAPGACSNSCPSSQWCPPTISSSVVPLSSCLQASGSFLMSVFFVSGGHNWSFSFSISPSDKYSGLISFRINWSDLFAVQVQFQSLLQHQSPKASILRCSAFFMGQLSHPYKTTGKTVSLTGQTFVGKVMSLLFNMLSRLVIAFLPRRKRLLISWLQSSSAVTLQPKKIKSVPVSIVSPFAMKWQDQMPQSTLFECRVLSQFFHSPFSLSSRGSLIPLHFLP